MTSGPRRTSPSRARLAIPALLAVGVIAAGVALSGGLGSPPVPPGGSGGAGGSGPPLASGGAASGGASAVPTPTPQPTPRPLLGGTELYGYLPYWQMSATIATYLRDVPVSTLALFSVSARTSGGLDDRLLGYRRIHGDIGRRLIREAHDRKASVDLVFTSFGADRNAVFFGRVAPQPAGSPAPSSAPTGGGSLTPSPSPSPSPAASPTPAPTPSGPPPWQRTARELVALVRNLGLDGLNVDVELLDPLDREAYGAFLRALRAGLDDVDPRLRLSVATEANERGAANAMAALASGVDRVFLMGYDYHWSGSNAGSSAPVDRLDGVMTLRWSVDTYASLGIPRDRVLLGLPLYGMSWSVPYPDRFGTPLAPGQPWFPYRHLDTLLDPTFAPQRDALEGSEFFVEQTGDTWQITYYDSPATLRPKLALARDAGFAGAGFWALGYDRGVPGYHELMADFRAGRVAREEAPPKPLP